jgi:hypothetical protein
MPVADDEPAIASPIFGSTSRRAASRVYAHAHEVGRLRVWWSGGEATCSPESLERLRACDGSGMSAAKTRLMYIQRGRAPGRIGRVRLSKTGRTTFYGDRARLARRARSQGQLHQQRDQRGLLGVGSSQGWTGHSLPGAGRDRRRRRRMQLHRDDVEHAGSQRREPRGCKFVPCRGLDSSRMLA